MQLHAFLGSYFDNIDNASPMVVLYKSSSREHSNSYQELIASYSSKNVTFIKETAFRAQLIDTLASTTASRIVFYVDDIIFTHGFDYSLLNTLNPYTTVAALSRGQDLTYSTVLLRELTLPQFTPLSKGLLGFKWNELDEFSDWTFPLGVSGFMYARAEVLCMLQSMEFKAPNSLEANLQVYRPFFIHRFGACAPNAVAVCVHANLTQVEYLSNPTINTFTVESLLKHWEAGKCIDRQAYYNKPMRVSQEQTYLFTDR